jgi:hypothetical protein
MDDEMYTVGPMDNEYRPKEINRKVKRKVNMNKKIKLIVQNLQ